MGSRRRQDGTGAKGGKQRRRNGRKMGTEQLGAEMTGKVRAESAQRNRFREHRKRHASGCCLWLRSAPFARLPFFCHQFFCLSVLNPFIRLCLSVTSVASCPICLLCIFLSSFFCLSSEA